MTDLTRRGLFGAGAAATLAAACETTTPLGAAAAKGAFNHGVASGDPTQEAVILWTRVTPEDPMAQIAVNWFLASDVGFKSIVKKGVVMTGPERDHTVKVDVTGLAEGQIYFYYFAVGMTSSPGGTTRTLPATGVADYRMAVVSCSNYPFGFFNVYREIGKRTDLHAVIHLGDYIYEYGRTGYGGEVGKQLGREHEPASECIKLADYRMRHAQYRSDPDLQAAHAAAPWFVVWDDHETANNSHVTGAENHQPETEGLWEDRKAAAVQAYFEWLPVREPAPGLARYAIYRKFDIGDLATLFMIETRLIARGDDLNLDPVWLATPKDQPAVIADIKAKVFSPERTLLGGQQEAWLAQGLKDSVAQGKKWQVLGNQVVMAKIKMPDLQKGLPPADYSKVGQGSKRFYESGKMGLEWNFDAWSGYPLARERLYQAVTDAKAKLIALAGDSHTAWANELIDNRGARVGVEFACTAVTSNGAGDSLPYKQLNLMMTSANPDVIYYNAFDKGFTLVTLKADQVEADFIRVSTVRSRDYSSSLDARFIARAASVGMEGLTRAMASTVEGGRLPPAKRPN
jgi:alkaline phosphatase D